MCCNFLHFASVQLVVSIHSSSSVRIALKSVPEESSSEDDGLALVAITIKDKYYRINVYTLVQYDTIAYSRNWCCFWYGIVYN